MPAKKRSKLTGYTVQAKLANRRVQIKQKTSWRSQQLSTIKYRIKQMSLIEIWLSERTLTGQRSAHILLRMGLQKLFGFCLLISLIGSGDLWILRVIDKDKGFKQKRRKKDVAPVWGTEFNNFLAALAILQQDDTKKRMNSSYSSNRIGAK